MVNKLINPDNKMEEVRNELYEAIQGGNEDEIKRSFQNFTESIQNSVMDVARRSMMTVDDNKIVENRGIGIALTSEERRYFNKVIDLSGFAGIEEALPTTVVETALNKIETEHPLLSRVDKRVIKGIAKILYTDSEALAFWGPICAEIKQILVDGLKVANITTSKLSGFIPVCKGMLELGAEWLAQYVIKVLYEAISASLEIAIVQGDGNNQPIGMMKALKGAVDGVYKDKTAEIVKDLEPKTLGAIRAKMASAKVDSSQVALIVNPVTYWGKLFAELVYRSAEGVWIKDKLSTGEDIIMTYAVPEDKAILGDPKNYLLAVSAEARVEKYTETLAIEDHDLYIAKMFATGTPKSESAFTVLDLSGIGASASGGGARSAK